jgi:quinol monooxygenase YgiN
MSYAVVARLVAQDEHGDEIEAFLREFVPQCRPEPGYRDFVGHESVDRPERVPAFPTAGSRTFVDHQASASV